LNVLRRINYYLICFKDECDTPFVTYSDLCVYLNKIFKSGNWGVTIGIRAGRSVRPNRESSDVVLELEYYSCSNLCLLCRELRWLVEMMLLLLLPWKQLERDGILMFSLMASLSIENQAVIDKLMWLQMP